MGWFRALKASFINNREVRPGDVFQYDGQPGSALRPMSDDEIKKHLAALDIPPTKSVEQRLDELELAVGRDYIAKAVERKVADDAKRAAYEKAKADRAAKAASDKAEADAKAQADAAAKVETDKAAADAEAAGKAKAEA